MTRRYLLAWCVACGLAATAVCVWCCVLAERAIAEAAADWW